MNKKISTIFFAAIIAVLFIIPSAFALNWWDPEWLPRGTSNPNTIEFGDSAEAGSGAFRSYDDHADYSVRLEAADGSWNSGILESKEVRMSYILDGETRYQTGYERITIDDSIYPRAGTYNLIFTIDDSRVTPQTKQLTLIVNPEAPAEVNHAPILTDVTNKNVVLGHEVSFPVRATDADSDDVDILINGRPSAARFEKQSSGQYVFTWTPSEGNVGPHEISFTAVDEHGARSRTDTIIITVSAPEEPEELEESDDFEVSLRVRENDLTECHSYRLIADVLPFGGAESYEWNLNDGTLPVVTATRYIDHRFDDQGTFTPSVTAIRADGLRATDDMDIHVSDVDPHVNIRASTDTIFEGGTVRFTATSAVPCNAEHITEYEWRFGDGTSETTESSRLTESISHMFRAPGEKTITVIVHDEDSTSRASVTINVLEVEEPPEPEEDLVAAFTWTPSEPTDEDTVRFIDRSTPEDAIVRRVWYIPGGPQRASEDGTVISPIHRFDPGTYNVCLEIFSETDAATHCEEIIISEHEEPSDPEELTVTVSATPDLGDTPLRSNLVCSADGGVPPYDYEIYINEFREYSTNNVFHVFDLAGEHSVECVVHDSEGQIETATADVLVEEYEAPVEPGELSAELIVRNKEGNEPFATSMYCRVSGGVPPYRTRIYFDDGHSFMGDDAEHLYEEDGTYEPECRVTDSERTTVTDTDTVYVNNVVPILDFTSDITEGETPLIVTFNCAADGGNRPFIKEGIVFSEDDYRDGLGEHVNTYDEPGIYEAVCEVYDADNDLVEESITIIAYDKPPVDPEADSIIELELDVSPDTGMAPLEVTATCTPVNGTAPFSYEIDFGDGTVLPGDEVGAATYTYEDAGLYRVTCDAEDAFGREGRERSSVEIGRELPGLRYDFSWSPDSPSVGEEVEFDSDLIDRDRIARLIWHFDDDSRAYVEDPVHIFGEAGSYDVRLIALDEYWNEYTVEHTVHVGVNPPDVQFNVLPDSETEPQSISVDCLPGIDDDRIEYNIDFGDSTPAYTEGPSVDHLYPQNGIYEVSCTLSIEDEWTVHRSTAVEIEDTVPEIMVFEITPADGIDVGETVRVHTTTSAYDTPYTVFVDFGDGTNSAVEKGELDPAAEIFEKVYDEPGMYEVHLIVTDADGSVTEDTRMIPVGLELFNVRFMAVQRSDTEPSRVEFLCSASGGVGPYEYVINFADPESAPGEESAEARFAEHTYTQNGEFDATCTATDALGVESVAIQHISVEDTVPEAGFTYSDHPLEGEEVHFDSIVSAYDDELILYEWDFGDDLGEESISYDEDPDHTYAREGTYNVTLEVTDSDVSSVIVWREITVENNAPVVALYADSIVGLEGLSVNFTCEVGDGNEPFEYVIDYGDGTITAFDEDGSGEELGRLLETEHVYEDAGEWFASCTATDADGDARTSPSVRILVEGNAPEVQLTGNDVSEIITVREGEDIDFLCDITDGDEPFDTTLDLELERFEGVTEMTYSYAREGEYLTFCNVTDATGDFARDELIVNVTNYPPHAILDIDPTSGVEPLTINYTCIGAEGNPSVGDDGETEYGYLVSFGDDTEPRDTPEGTHTYQALGEYVVNCTVTDSDGDSDWDSDVVTVGDNLPEVTLSYEYVGGAGEGLEGAELEFTCGVENGNPEYHYELFYGENPVGAPADFTYDGEEMEAVDRNVYEREGTYIVNCTVSDADGDLDYAEQEIVIDNNVPIAHLELNTSRGSEPLSIEYGCSYFGGNEPVEVFVDFGDGSPHGGAEGLHTYAEPGVYTVNCTATDIDLDKTSQIAIVVVEDNAPVVELSYSYEGELREGTEVTFGCDVAGGNPEYHYELFYGTGPEGVPDYEYDGEETSISEITYTYRYEGEYTINCSVTDADGDTRSDSEFISVANNAPVTNLISNISVTDTTRGTEPLSVLLNCTVGDGNPPYRYDIYFGDESLPSFDGPAVLSHVYEQNSTYDATCNVTDSDGDSDIDVMTVIVGDTRPDVNFTYGPESPIEGDSVIFTDRSYAYDGISSREWDFGDGNTTTGDIVSHTYTREGDYLVVLRVTDNDGSENTYSESVHIGNNVPEVTLEVVMPEDMTEPIDVDVMCSAVGGNAPLTYEIQYGDGETTEDLVSSHTYDEDGSYPVVCTVSDFDLDGVSRVVVVDVEDSEPTAAFDYTPVNPRAGQAINFTDESTGYDEIIGWSWDFNGDGAADSLEQNVTYEFDSPGIYAVNLTVTDDDGSTDSASRVVVVNVTIPLPPAPIIEGVRVTDLTNESATIIWGTTTLADSLVYYGETEDLGDFEDDAELWFEHEIAITGLSEETTYYFNVTSCDAFDQCVTEGLFNFTTLDSTPPEGVTNLAEESVGETWINWWWGNPLDADFDHVEIWVGGNFVDNTTDTEYNVTGLDPDTSYSIEVISVDTSGNRRVPGETDSATTLSGEDLTPPAPVSDLGETGVGVDWIEWSWSNPVDLDFEHVVVYVNGNFIGDTSGESVNVSGLDPDTVYEIEVITVDEAGNRNAPGETDSATTLELDQTPPRDVLNLTEESVGETWINWWWENPSDEDFDHVEVWLLGDFLDNTTVTEYNVTGLEPDTSYSIEVIAVDSAGNRRFPGETDSARTLPGEDLIPPGPVSDLDEIGVGVDWIEWSWSNPVDIDFDHVEVYVDGSFIGNTSGESINVTGLDADTEYEIEVISVDEIDNRNTPGETDLATTGEEPVVDTIPDVNITATPDLGSFPLSVKFNSTVTSGNAPFMYSWDVDGDGSTDYALANPLHIYNAEGVYTVSLNVSDSDGDWDTDTIDVTVTSAVHDVGVESFTYTGDGRTVYLYDDVVVSAMVNNEGTVEETFTLELEVNGVVIDILSVTLDAGDTEEYDLNWLNASTEGWNTVVVRAIPVDDESDIGDQSVLRNVRVWSVDDIVGASTRYIMFWGGVAYVPILNEYINQTFYDLNVELTSATATVTPPTLQAVTLAPSETRILMWSVPDAIFGSGDVLTITEGNDEVVFLTTT